MDVQLQAAHAEPRLPRLRNPLRVAEIVLEHDKGWDGDKVQQLAKSGPMNNEIVMEKRIRMHLAYFTMWVDDSGALKTYSDIYGHEKRVTQALDGQWTKISKGRDHLAPVEPDRAHLAEKAQQKPSRVSQSANDDFFSGFFGRDFKFRPLTSPGGRLCEALSSVAWGPAVHCHRLPT